MNEQWLSVIALLLPIGAAIAEWLLGLPRLWHPLYYFQIVANALSNRVNRAENGPKQQQLAGSMAMWLLLAVILLTYWGLSVLADMPLLLDGISLFLLLTWRPLMHDLKQVSEKLQKGQLPLARLQLAHWVLRDTHQLSQAQITAAASESLIIRLAHGWFATLFWYALFGIYGALTYRIIELLHQTWNRKLADYQQFGKSSDQIHHLLAYVPDLLLAWLMCLIGSPGKNWHQYQLGFRWPRTPSGRLIGITASWLNAQLGGQRYYQGLIRSFALFGAKNQVTLTSDFKHLCIRCYLVAGYYLVLVIYPILLCRYIIIGL
ncbi:cobalamin biosynthesis protein CobD/CbiB [Celerinatantimonas diazotrophica]|uniref:Adenosylcobinamide-phosphate synthase n=1 Tax=Celerinatantimonas diazotrophica TaxID=412034 RepID=A0A4R1J8W1_9GAMM|nr:cobalamin biosynthesis protein [Celerinatantimonas diazotrophica]TCK46940.1 adenosylcobinamide-phosphate synthase [Celerinatantimonas diazotrophica]CAG9295708.1 Cobalamin biosynthesis protein CbiB [Celerinatantimonas diazotrophica]